MSQIETPAITVRNARGNASGRVNGILSFTASPYSIEGYAVFDTTDERDAALAVFPKSYNVKTSTLSGRDSATNTNWTLPALRVRAVIKANGVNGGDNETGIARIRKVVAKATIPLEYVICYMNSLTAEEFLSIAVGA